MTTDHQPTPHQPFTGLTVIDMTQILAGPYCTRLLADGGATVIKIESPTGDPSRHLPPAITANNSGYFANLNAGKLSVQVDLRTDDGIAAVRELARTADVFVENARPGALASKGLGYEALSELNPRLVYASISAFGNTGSFAGAAGQGIIAEAYSGAIAMTGFPDGPPTPLGISLADVSAGIHAYGGIVTALYRRDRSDTADTGGDYIDVGLFDAALPFHETAFVDVAVNGDSANPTRNGTEHPSVSPYGVFRAADGYLAIAAGTDALWRRLAVIIGAPSPEVDLSTNEARVANRAIVKELIESWAERTGSASEALNILREAGVPAGPIRAVRDVARTEPAVSRGSFALIPDPDLGHIPIVNTPFRMSRSRVGPARRAPRLGEHTQAVMEGHE